MPGSENYQNQLKIKELTILNGKLSVKVCELKNEINLLKISNAELKAISNERKWYYCSVKKS